MSDLVNHPAHYEEQSIKLEPIDFCELFPFCEGNALKYCFRAGHKDGASELQDLKKAQWYLKRAQTEGAAEVDKSEEIDVALRMLCKAKGLLGEAARGYQDNWYGLSFWEVLGNCIKNRIEKLENENGQTNSRQE